MTKTLLRIFILAVVILAAATVTKKVSPDYGTTPEKAEAVFAYGKSFLPFSSLDIRRLQDAGCDVTAEKNGNFTAFCPMVDVLRVHPTTKIRAVGLTVAQNNSNALP